MCLILLYDDTNKESFDKIPRWMDLIKDLGEKKIYQAPIAIKNDLKHRVITKEMG